MKKLIITLSILFIFLTGCKKEPHWSYENCLTTIEQYAWITHIYTYEVEELEYDKTTVKDGVEVHYFIITITSNNKTRKYNCYTFLQDNEIIDIEINNLWW